MIIKFFNLKCHDFEGIKACKQNLKNIDLLSSDPKALGLIEFVFSKLEHIMIVYTAFVKKFGANDNNQLLPSFNEIPISDKLDSILKLVTKPNVSKWQDELEVLRAQNIPVIICRVC